MVSVLSKSKLSEGMHIIMLKTPEMAKKARPGQYVLIKKTEDSPNVPIFIADTDKKGVSVIIDSNSQEGKLLGDLKKGTELYGVNGPLGRPIRLGDIGNVCIVSDAKGIGAAMMISNILRNFENKVYFIASFTGKKQRFWESKIKKSADKFLIVTSKPDAPVDSTVSELYGLLRRKHINMVIGLTEPKMLGKISKATELRSKTVAMLLPPIGDDGIGISSHCRFSYDNESKLACIEGPPIDGHKVDWSSVLLRR